jgi:hypothetical protein
VKHSVRSLAICVVAATALMQLESLGGKASLGTHQPNCPNILPCPPANFNFNP